MPHPNASEAIRRLITTYPEWSAAQIASHLQELSPDFPKVNAAYVRVVRSNMRKEQAMEAMIQKHRTLESINTPCTG